MNTIKAADFQKNSLDILEQTIKYNEPVQIATKDGNAVLLSADDYNDLMATLELSSVPGMQEKIIEGLNTSLTECLSEDEVSW